MIIMWLWWYICHVTSCEPSQLHIVQLSFYRMTSVAFLSGGVRFCYVRFATWSDLSTGWRHFMWNIHNQHPRYYMQYIAYTYMYVTWVVPIVSFIVPCVTIQRRVTSLLTTALPTSSFVRISYNWQRSYRYISYASVFTYVYMCMYASCVTSLHYTTPFFLEEYIFYCKKSWFRGKWKYCDL